MTTRPQDRRQFQRFDLDTPIRGRLGPVEVFLVDIGVLGTLIEHDAPLETSQTARLIFPWKNRSLELDSEVVYTSGSPLSDPDHPERGARKRHSGLRFREAIGDSDERLRELIMDCANRALEPKEASAILEWKAKAQQTRAAAGHEAAAIGFLTYHFGRSGWKKTATDQSKQPPDGFTVAASEDETHLQLLCRAWETTSQEGRNSIRALAELSVSKAQGLPKRSSG